MVEVTAPEVTAPEPAAHEPAGPELTEPERNRRLRGYVEEFGGVAGSVHCVHRDDLLLVADVNLPEPLRAAVAVIPRGKGMAGTAWLRGEPLQSCDLKTDTAGGVVKPGARAVGAAAAVALPVRGADGEVVGVVGIAFDDEREIPEAEIRELTRAAAVLFDGGAEPDEAVLDEAVPHEPKWDEDAPDEAVRPVPAAGSVSR